MYSLLIKSSLTTLLIAIFLILPSSVSAGVGSLRGDVKVKTTGVGVPGVWVKWQGKIPYSSDPGWLRAYGNESYPADGTYPTKYVQTDNSGNFIFPEWQTVSPLSKERVEYRAQQYLTWIKPDEPEIAPDTTAFRTIFLPAMAGVNYSDTNASVPKTVQALRTASTYRPSGNGWVRLASTAAPDGGYQCNNDFPTVTAIAPKSWGGSWENNDQEARLNNNTGSLKLDTSIYFIPPNVTGYHDGNGSNSSDPKPITVSSSEFKVRGWARIPGNDAYKVNVDIYYKDINPQTNQETGDLQTVARVVANQFRSDLGAESGFEYQLPNNLRDGKPRNYYVFAFTGANNPQLNLSPRQMIGQADPNSTPTPTPATQNPTPTPTPQAPPQDLTLDLYAQSGTKIAGKNPLNTTVLEIDVDQRAVLNWDISGNPDQCWASGDWGNLQYPPNNSFTTPVLSEVKTYTYTLTCYDLRTGRSPVSDTVLITTKPTQTAPFIQTSGGDVHSNQKIETQQAQ